MAKRTWLEMPTRHEEWLVLTSWKVLHRVSEIEPNDLEDGLPNGLGVTVCGQRGHLMIPGFISRMGLRRCAHCCDALGIIRGAGNTLNGKIEEPPGVRWEHYDALLAAWKAAPSLSGDE